MAKWERYHRAEAASAERTRLLEQEELLNDLEHHLLAVSLGDSGAAAAMSAHSLHSLDTQLRRRRSGLPDDSVLRRSDSGVSAGDDDDLLARIAELEKLCKQKVWVVCMPRGIAWVGLGFWCILSHG